MLQTLSIKNVALISSLTIDFGKGFNVLLGETGAGKSIIFDALNFVLGAKLDKTLLRSGEETMRVDAVFSEINPHARQLLAEYGYEEDELVLSRTYSQDGKNTIRINGLPTTLSVLKDVGDILVDSYSQHESIDMLKVKNHIGMLDRFGGDEVQQAKNAVKELYQQKQDIDAKIKDLGGNDEERARTLSILEYQINEIEDAQLRPGEDEEIKDRLKFLSNAEKIFQAISSCEALLSDNPDCAINALQQSSGLLAMFTGFEQLENCRERLDSARYEIEDICQTLTDIKSSTEFDEGELEELDRRYDLIKSLLRKYGGTIEKTLDFYQEAKQRYNELENSAAIIDDLEKQKEKISKQLDIACQNLTALRKKYAEEISFKITTQLRELGMKSSSFDVKFEALPSPTSNGIDSVEFIFSANKGQEMKSLAKTASGGELSRFMLAVKNIFAGIGSAQTLIFDEIDAGISGETGNIVGQKLSNITKFAQVLCITHLPQVACYGDEFFYVKKSENGDTTTTSVEHLSEDKIISSLARMTGGDLVSEIALSHAREMRDRALKHA